MVVKFKEENLMTFKHLFLKDYVDGEMETYALYRQSDVYDHVYYVIEQVVDFCFFFFCFFFFLFKRGGYFVKLYECGFIFIPL